MARRRALLCARVRRVTRDTRLCCSPPLRRDALPYGSIHLLPSFLPATTYATLRDARAVATTWQRGAVKPGVSISGARAVASRVCAHDAARDIGVRVTFSAAIFATLARGGRIYLWWRWAPRELLNFYCARVLLPPRLPHTFRTHARLLPAYARLP